MKGKKYQYVDLISRNEVLEILRDPHPLYYNGVSVVQKIIDLPSIKVVLSDIDNVCEMFETIETIEE